MHQLCSVNIFAVEAVVKIMPCPFVGRLSGSFSARYSSLLKIYATHCPAVAATKPQSLVSVPRRNVTTKASDNQSAKPDQESCPSISGSEIFYDYEGHFQDQILQKKLDHSYRVFKKVNRNAQNFPTAREYTWGEKEINVWCSNDYLGMSAHPKVTSAVK